MRPSPPPAHNRPSPPLSAQIDRDFGSMEDFRHALDHMTSGRRHGGDVWLVCTPQGRLRLVHTPPGVRPHGLPLFRFPIGGGSPPPPRPGEHRTPPPRPDWRDANERYDQHIHRRPPYPMP